MIKISGILENPPFHRFQSFPCDVQLLAVRPLNSDINRRLMILHRAGIDCTSLNAPTCRGNELDVSIVLNLRQIICKKMRGKLTDQSTIR